MSSQLFEVATIGLVLGFRHAFEPDHLAVVTTLSTRQGSLGAAARLGLAWAVGHTASVGAVALLLIGSGAHLPERLWPAADGLVALLLIGLGGSVIWRYARGRWHLHRHDHAGTTHLHLHRHDHGGGHAHVHRPADARRSLGFGLLHGLAGGASIVLLLIAAAPTRGAQLAYFAAFGLGTITGMLSVSFGIGMVMAAASTWSARFATVMHVGAAAASVVVGLALAIRVTHTL